MNDTHHSLFNVLAKFEPISEPINTIPRLSAKDGKITPQESKHILDWLLYETRSALLRTLQSNPNHISNGFNQNADITKAPLHEKCTFSQCIAAYALIDRGLDPKTFSTQSLPNYTIGHAMLTVSISQTDGEALYLIDPTYRQFYDSMKPRNEERDMPGFILEKMNGGSEILEKLLSDGYIKVTPEIADTYLSSFCDGKSPFASKEEAMVFMKAPPYDNAYYFMNRDVMNEQGYLIQKPS